MSSRAMFPIFPIYVPTIMLKFMGIYLPWIKYVLHSYFFYTVYKFVRIHWCFSVRRYPELTCTLYLSCYLHVSSSFKGTTVIHSSHSLFLLLCMSPQFFFFFSSEVVRKPFKMWGICTSMANTLCWLPILFQVKCEFITGKCNTF